MKGNNISDEGISDQGISDQDISGDQDFYGGALTDDDSVDGAGAADEAVSVVEPAEPTEESHRGGFGEFGGETRGLIERTYRERILLVAVAIDGAGGAGTVEDSLDELALLVDTAGADVVGRITQRRRAPDPATYVGSGKAAEIKALAEATDCDTVVFDDELSPAQQFKLEKLLGRTAIDRTAVILDIFAQNASSQEGKAQVELAQLRYLAPRLKGRGRALSQQAGGLGGARRGPGEKALETDRRRLGRRVHKLESELREVGRHRATQAKARQRSGVAHVVVVGYTNAGKSTLENALTDAGVLVEDRLFATLDPTTRQLALPGVEVVLLTDTVGFIRKLPHELVEAFKTTLSVVSEADLLVHVVDASSSDPAEEIAVVRAIIAEVGGGDRPELLVFNKADLSPDADRLAEASPGAVAVSAATGLGIDALVEAIGDRLRSQRPVVELHIPWARGDVIASVHAHGEVLSEVSGPDQMVMRTRLREEQRGRFAEFEPAAPVEPR